MCDIDITMQACTVFTTVDNPLMSDHNHEQRLIGLYSNAIHIHACTIHIYFLPVVLVVVQTKATSSKWEQSSFPIKLAGQFMSLLSIPEH